eukprot:1152540-Pelagomonas_calceolata.AAC.3
MKKEKKQIQSAWAQETLPTSIKDCINVAIVGGSAERWLNPGLAASMHSLQSQGHEFAAWQAVWRCFTQVHMKKEDWVVPGGPTFRAWAFAQWQHHMQARTEGEGHPTQTCVCVCVCVRVCARLGLLACRLGMEALCSMHIYKPRTERSPQALSMQSGVQYAHIEQRARTEYDICTWISMQQEEYRMHLQSSTHTHTHTHTHARTHTQTYTYTHSMPPAQGKHRAAGLEIGGIYGAQVEAIILSTNGARQAWENDPGEVYELQHPPIIQSTHSTQHTHTWHLPVHEWQHPPIIPEAPTIQSTQHTRTCVPMVLTWHLATTPAARCLEWALPAAPGPQQAQQGPPGPHAQPLQHQAQEVLNVQAAAYSMRRSSSFLQLLASIRPPRPSCAASAASSTR